MCASAHARIRVLVSLHRFSANEAGDSVGLSDGTACQQAWRQPPADTFHVEVGGGRDGGDVGGGGRREGGIGGEGEAGWC